MNVQTDQNGAYIEGLLRAYFSDPKYQIKLKQGEVLMRQGEANDRLYVLLSGRMLAEQEGESGLTAELFQAKSNRFLGVYSFFSETYSSAMTLVAKEDCTLAFLDRQRFFELRSKGDPLFERFMPVVVTELVNRYRQTHELTIAREKAFEKLLQTEKAASLGQMAAGVAHELNNAIAVLERNSEWVSEGLATVFGDKIKSATYQRGLTEGSHMSSRERRQKRMVLQKETKLDARTAEKLVELGVEPSDVRKFDQEHVLDDVHLAWKMGTALHDVLVASRQAAHVVRSMKLLGMPTSEPLQQVKVNDTIQDALSLLKSMTDGVEMTLKLGVLPEIAAHPGELVQVWLNLLKNACESMEGTPDRRLEIESCQRGNVIVVRIADWGCGIPQDIIHHIFQPNVTTKVDGLSFGLGLGLPIVQRLVQRIHGEVCVQSKPGHTVFTVELPVEKNI